MNLKLIQTLIFIALLLSTGSPQSQAKTEKAAKLDLSHGVVSLQVYQQGYDWMNPWDKKAVRRQKGYAIVLSDKRLLTTADLVANQVLIEVRKNGNSIPFQAELETMDFAVNLAVLKVKDEQFWQELNPLPWGTPELGEIKLGTWQNPYSWQELPGKNKNLTMGFRSVSRMRLPMLEIEVAGKLEGQGEPILIKGKLIGMSMQTNGSGVDALPTFFLQEFLDRVKSPNYLGFPSRGFLWESLIQHSQRDFYQIPVTQEGVLVTRLAFDGTGSDVLQVDDYLIEIQGWKISNDGRIKHPKWDKVQFDFLFATEYDLGQQITFKVLRKGKLLALNVIVKTYLPQLRFVPLTQLQQTPHYLMRAGLLMQELTMNYLEIWGNDWDNKAPLRLRVAAQLESDLEKNRGRHMVILTRILPDPINIGYDNLSHLPIQRINGKEILSLDDAVVAFKNPQGAYHRLEFLPGSARQEIILPVAEIAEADQRIQKNYQIP